MIKILDLNVNKVSIEKLEYNTEQVGNLKINEISEKSREENLEKIRRIMMEGALNQLSFENCSDAKEKNVVIVKDNGKIEFIDI